MHPPYIYYYYASKILPSSGPPSAFIFSFRGMRDSPLPLPLPPKQDRIWIIRNPIFLAFIPVIFHILPTNLTNFRIITLLVSLLLTSRKKKNAISSHSFKSDAVRVHVTRRKKTTRYILWKQDRNRAEMVEILSFLSGHLYWKPA